MSQRGKPRTIQGNKFVPHVITDRPFDPISGDSIIDKIIVLENRLPWANTELINTKLSVIHVGKPYSLWEKALNKEEFIEELKLQKKAYLKTVDDGPAMCCCGSEWDYAEGELNSFIEWLNLQLEK